MSTLWLLFTDDFSPYFAPGTQEAITEKITSQVEGTIIQCRTEVEEAIKAYKLAYLSAMFKKEKVLQWQESPYELHGYIVKKARR